VLEGAEAAVQTTEVVINAHDESFLLAPSITQIEFDLRQELLAIKALLNGDD